MPTDPHDDRLGPRQSDPHSASAARIYDYILGGSHHSPVDRAAAEQVLERMPRAREQARQNRMWMRRAVRQLVNEYGVHQFLDIGSGIPTGGNVHEVAQEIVPTARVVYVDYERIAVDRSLEILEDNPYATALHADLRQPQSILRHPTTTDMLDFGQPVAVVLASVLHFIEDRDDPFGTIARYKEALKPGDYLALSHSAWPAAATEIDQHATKGVAAYNETVTEMITIRSIDSIMRFFAGTDLLEPGLVPLAAWRPEDPDHLDSPAGQNQADTLAGVGRIR